MPQVSSSAETASRQRGLKGYSRITILALVWVGVALITLRILLWPIHSLDLDTAFLPWQDMLITQGRLSSLRHPLSDYFPAYFELTLLTSLLDGWISRVAQVKVGPLCFDLLGAYCSFLLVKHLQRAEPRLAQGVKPRIAAVFVILAGPTVILNSAAWGQTDMLYTALLVLSVYLICSGRGAWSSLTYGIALAFKLQSIFLAPFYVAMLLRRRVPLWSLALLPVGWIAALLPVLIAGGSPRDFMGLPLVQAKEFRSLSTAAENIWQVGNVLHIPYGPGVAIGIGLGGIASLLIVFAAKRIKPEDNHALVTLSALCLFIIPYVLPKMHDRYFFAAEVLLAILACVDLHFLLPAALLTCSSLIAYIGYFWGGLYRPPKMVGLVASTLALIMLTSYFLRMIRPDHRNVSTH